MKNIFDLNKVIILLYVIFSPIQATVFEQNNLSVIINFAILLLIIISLLYGRSLYISKETKIIVYLYTIPILISISHVYIHLWFNGFDILYMNYVSTHMINRIITSFTNIIIYIYICSEIDRNNTNNIKNIFLYSYFLVVGTITTVGIWQLSNFIFGIPFININTRTYMHSVDTYLFIYQNRLTSITREPSFLVPFVVEFYILTLLIFNNKKYKYLFMLLSVIVLIFTFAGSAIIEVFFLLFGYLVCSKRIKIKGLIYITSIISGILFLFNEFIRNIALPYVERFMNITLFSNARLYHLWQTPYFTIRSGPLAFFFGHGPNSYKYLGEIELYPYQMGFRAGMYLEGGTNNIFADALFELGAIGLISYALLVTKYIKYFFINRLSNEYNRIGFFLSLHFLASSLYRGDYSAPRFFVLLIILKILKNIKYMHE